jgi:ribosome biogenesis GTPase
MFDVDFDSLVPLGWTPFFHQQCLELAPTPALEGAVPERVAAEGRTQFTLVGGAAPRPAALSGKLLHRMDAPSRPTVGDWVLATPGELGRIEHVFARATVFRRKASGKTSEAQPIAANVDVAFIVAALSLAEGDSTALDHALSLRRLERYVRAVTGAGVRPVVVVNKADVRADAQEVVEGRLAPLREVEVVLVSAASGLGMDRLLGCIRRAESVVLIGSSGVGKSSLTNRMLGRDAQRVSEVRDADARGRHTTTHRELFALPSGGVLIDTPGMRELGLFAGEDEDLSLTGFSDVDTLASRCRFGDCRHVDEPGCAVLAAIDSGVLPEERLAHAKKLHRELAWQKQRQDGLTRLQAKKQHRALTRSVRERLVMKGRK